MNISRRFFIGGAASFGAFGGCRLFTAHDYRCGGTPNLKFGVVSDIHITKVGANEKMSAWGNNLTFRHTLEWFRDQGVDAVLIAGDMADNGLVEQLEAVAQAWYAVFPNDRYPDGRPVEKVFVYGNHDWEGWSYGDMAKKLYPDEAERNRHILRQDYGGWWEKIFHEAYAPIYRKEIKGYSFIGSHWTAPAGAQGWGAAYKAFDRILPFMEKEGGKVDPSLPFFYVQHPHPKDTCYGPWAWGHDAGDVTKCLSAYSNAVAFTGHSHYSLTDERSVWQGTFTSVGTSSLRYTGMPYDEHKPVGYENTTTEVKDAWRYNAPKLSPNFSAGDCRQGMLWSVYDDCMVVKRREFLSDLDVGDDWVLPLPAAESKPFAFAERAKSVLAPAFVANAKLEVKRTKAKNRGGASRDGKEKIPSVEKDVYRVTAPAAVAESRGRLYDLEFVAEGKNGEKKSKLVMAEGYNHSTRHAKALVRTSCCFALDELPAGEVRFTVIPRNCFGKAGTPATSGWLS